MSEKTKIQWCDDTNNFWRICTKISPGCLNCYAVTATIVRINKEEWGKGKPRIRSEAAFLKPYSWNKKPWVCDNCGKYHQTFANHNYQNTPLVDCICRNPHLAHAPELAHRRRVFSLSIGDWLDTESPIKNLADMMKVVLECSSLNWLLVTKRPENFFSQLESAQDWHFDQGDRDIAGKLSDWRKHSIAPENVWFGFTAENQKCLDERWNHAKKIPAVQHFISAEPMLQQMDFTRVIQEAKAFGFKLWFIFGGESGDNARRCNVEWIRKGVQQCSAAGFPVFVKQLGAFCTDTDFDADSLFRVWPGVDYEFNCAGVIYHLKHHKGGDIEEFPIDLRVRQFPSEPNQ
ncbi:MAG: hypothetical protein JWM68_3764 [Verrucomicrobiales bacterium]|nr:hypothetical protein [Verrucomicrobiales bacterium]